MNAEKTITEKWNKIKTSFNKLLKKKTGSHIMTEEEIVDEASEESFPASDSPGYRSKSQKDKALHGTVKFH